MALAVLFLMFACSNLLTNGEQTAEPQTASGAATEGLPAPDGVLQHVVLYEPMPPSPNYRSDDSFNARGMEHVYFVANTFLDFVQRENVLPISLNVSSISEAGQKDTKVQQLVQDHWQDILLQYIGVLTAAIFGLFLALLIPCIGFWFCCCRCCGRCGAYPDTHYDKKSDACKRHCLGILVAFFVMASVFGVVCAFVTNHYSYEGSNHLTEKLDASLDDVGMYLEHTGVSVKTLLVTNYAELETVIGEVLDDSGVILKDSLASVTKAIAINNLTEIVAGLGKIRLNLKDILKDSEILEVKVGRLKVGLSQAQGHLTQALNDCKSDNRCRNFIRDNDLEKDLALADDFVNIRFEMPDLAVTLRSVSDLIQNNIEQRVMEGKEEFDKIEKDIEQSIDDIKPKVKLEIRALGQQLERQNNEIQAALREVDIGLIQKDIPLIDDSSQPFIEYRYYAGLVLASMVLLILLCFVFGLFYGMCGRRAGGLYGDECCNKGTGANCLITGIYLTFLFSFPILVGTTLHFMLGSTLEKVVCESLSAPEHSDLFSQVDKFYLQPTLSEVLNNGRRLRQNYTATELLSQCHANNTLFNILKLDQVYNMSQLADWRAHYGIGDFIENLKNKVQLNELSDIRLLSPETTLDLEELANSKISDMNFTRFTSLLENQITKIDLRSFIVKLRQLKEALLFDRNTDRAITIENQAMWLEGMNKVVTEMKVTLRHLKSSVNSLQENSRFNHSSMREAVRSLINQANSATDYLQTKGSSLVSDLSTQFAGEIVGLVDEYADRVNNKIQHEVGYCAPLSTSLNATVIALCNEIVDPFNGFWAAMGWCFMLYMPCIALGVSLVSLYRKSEPYPGPLVESQPLEVTGGQGGRSGHDMGSGKAGKKGNKGHRRNPSSFLPEYTHSRPGPPPTQQQPPYSDARYRDIAPRNYGADDSQQQAPPPRYSSNPTLPQAAPPSASLAAGGAPAGSSRWDAGYEYERPPPYNPGPPPPHHS